MNKPGFTMHEPCAMCGGKDTCMRIGPPATKEPFWLCWACFITTPAGQQMALANIKNALGPIDDGDDTEHSDCNEAGDGAGEAVRPPG